MKRMKRENHQAPSTSSTNSTVLADPIDESFPASVAEFASG